MADGGVTQGRKLRMGGGVAWRGQPNRRRGTLGGGALRTPETAATNAGDVCGDSTRGVGLRELIWGDLQKVELGWDECGGFKC